MAVREPGWWYRAPSLTSRVLRPLADIYGAIAVLRYRRATPYVSALPVICIGNFTAGGTGKTPFTRLVVGRLAAGGHRAAILTRGHGGRMRGPHWVAAGVDTAAEVGDEPLLLVRDAPTLVSRDRALGARAIEQDPRGFTAIVMDDGLQNPGLAKTLAFAVVDAARGFGNQSVMPAGPLRAPLAFQLGLVDALIVNRGAGGRGDGASLPAGKALIHVVVVPEGDVAWLRGYRVVAFAGIGAPQNFFTMLGDFGADLAGATAFADHHVITDTEAAALLVRARETGGVLVTTEKDAARLSAGSGRGTGAVGDLARLARVVAIRHVVETADSAALDRLLARAGLRGGDRAPRRQ